MNNVGKVFANMPQSPLNENLGLNNAEQVFDGFPKQTSLENGHESLIGRVPGLELEEERLSPGTDQQNMQQNLAKNPTETVTTHNEASIAQTHETPTNSASTGGKLQNTNTQLGGKATAELQAMKQGGTVIDTAEKGLLEKLDASLKEDSFTTPETSLSLLKGDPLRN
ncbi:hypothetical protein Leryth_024555 [Lithospermum erythrorhizon]|nr:hypothetical protein Leryth_024555 [Lithospermum erythrorhizon]